MHKLLLLATYIASALATLDSLPFKAKRTTTNSQCSQQKSTGDNSTVTVHYVEVGGAGGALTYTPDRLNGVLAGDFVQFNFNPKNHTVTESSFAEPCKPLAANLTSATRPGLKTGFVPVTGNETFTRAFTIQINDTKPMWLFCGQKNPKPHCQAGMVMVINEPTDPAKSLEQFRALAMAVPIPSASASTSASASAAAATDTVAPATTPAPTATDSVSAGPVLATSVSPVQTFTGNAMPIQRPRLAAVGGLAVAGAFAFL